MFTKKFERRIYLAFGTVLSSGLFGFCIFLYAMWPSNIVRGYEPEQPIAFSHEIHAGQYKIECIYCHSEVEKGPYATLPPVATCMNCHKYIQPKDRKGEIKPEIQKLLAYWNEKKPIIWNKVNDIADFVYFNHSRHIAVGIDCNQCHGEVETMETMRREYSLKMAFCLDCHLNPAAKGVKDIEKAPINCSTCHR